jgi:hypothetical protein
MTTANAPAASVVTNLSPTDNLTTNDLVDFNSSVNSTPMAGVQVIDPSDVLGTAPLTMQAVGQAAPLTMQAPVPVQVQAQPVSEISDDNLSLDDSSGASIVDILLEQNAISPDRAKQVKLAEIQTGKSQEAIIREQKVVPEMALIKARATYYNIPFVDLEQTPVSPAALSILPQEVARKFRAFPLSTDSTKKELQLAMADPLDLTAIEFIEQKTGYHIKPQAAVPATVDEYITKRYESTLSQEVTAALKDVSTPSVNTLDATKQSGGLELVKLLPTFWTLPYAHVQATFILNR